MSYAIISVGGKQYRVQEGQRLLVDRLAHGEGNTFTPTVLLVGGGEGGTQIAPQDVTVTVRVVADVKGEKIRIGKYRPKNGYRKHTGFRASLSQIEIESIGGKKRARGGEEGGGACEGRRRPRRSPRPCQGNAVGPRPEPRAPEEPWPRSASRACRRLRGADRRGDQGAGAGWNRPMLEAALEYEQAARQREGLPARRALESALAEKEESTRWHTRRGSAPPGTAATRRHSASA